MPQSNVFTGPFGLTAAGIAEALGYTPVNKAGDTMTGLLTIAQATANTRALSLSGYSLTGSSAVSLVELAGTWNTSGAPTAFNLVITDTASNTSSRFMRFTLGASIKWTVDKFGNMTGPGGNNTVASGWGSYTAGSGVAIPANGLLTLGFKATSTANFGVFFGSGAPNISAAQGSLYLRSDGSGVNDRAYIATDAAGTWTPLVTVG